MADDDTDLPEPDSPTIPRVCSRSSVYESPSVAFTSPSGVGKNTDRFSTERNGLFIAGTPLSQPHARVDVCVEDVDEDVHDDHGGAGHDDEADEHREV